MQKLIQSVCEIAAEEIGNEKAKRIREDAEKRQERLLEENRNDSKALRAHTYKRIYPAIAVYQALLAHGISSEKAVWFVREYFQRFSEKTVPHIQRLIRIFHLAPKIPELFLKISRRSFGEDAGFVYEFPESRGREARFNIVHCPYMETCRRYGCPKLTTAFCDGDDAGYGALHPDLFWGRTKTIGRGDPCCDFLLQYRGERK